MVLVKLSISFKEKSMQQSVQWKKQRQMVTMKMLHTPFLDDPEQFVEAVKTFLSECENKFVLNVSKKL